MNILTNLGIKGGGKKKRVESNKYELELTLIKFTYCGN